MPVGQQSQNEGFGVLGWFAFLVLLLGFMMALYMDQLMGNGHLP